MTIETPSATATDISFKKSYAQSWIDILTGRIERLSVKPWLFYLIVLLITSIMNNVVMWLDGTIEVGDIHPLFTFAAIYFVYGTAFYHYLKRIAADSLNDFFPVLYATSQKKQEWAFRMTTLPPIWAWVALIFGILMGVFDAFSSEGQYTLNSWGALTYAIFIGGFGYGSFLAMMFLTGKQLSIVINLHHQVSEIDLFNLAPLRAFSRLTARAGFAIFLVGAISALLFSEGTNLSLIAFYFGLVVLGILIFIIPLISIRTQIDKEKKKRLLEADQRLKLTLDQVRHCVQKDELAKMGSLNTTLSVLEQEKSILKKISSYPWNPGTLKSFVSTILLPLLLWWIKGLLETWF